MMNCCWAEIKVSLQMNFMMSSDWERAWFMMTTAVWLSVCTRIALDHSCPQRMVAVIIWYGLSGRRRERVRTVLVSTQMRTICLRGSRRNWWSGLHRCIS